VCPVFLFDVSIVVFLIGSASGELDGLFSFGKVPLKVIVEEFAAIVAIESKDREREGVFDMLICSRTPVSPFPHTARCSVQPVAKSRK
jgi:hypothetical protein